MPLALRIAAAKLTALPGQPVAGLVAELTERRLDTLSVPGDPHRIRTVLARRTGRCARWPPSCSAGSASTPDRPSPLA